MAGPATSSRYAPPLSNGGDIDDASFLAELGLLDDGPDWGGDDFELEPLLSSWGSGLELPAESSELSNAGEGSNGGGSHDHSAAVASEPPAAAAPSPPPAAHPSAGLQLVRCLDKSHRSPCSLCAPAPGAPTSLASAASCCSPPPQRKERTTTTSWWAKTGRRTEKVRRATLHLPFHQAADARAQSGCGASSRAARRRVTGLCLLRVFPARAY